MDVTVNALGSLTVTPAALSLVAGQSVTLTANAQDQGGSAVTVPVTWTSDDPAVVGVTSTTKTTATALALSAGTAEITARVGSVRAIVPVAVAGQAPPAFVTGGMRGSTT